MEIKIEGDFDANELRAALEKAMSQSEFRPVRGRSQTRMVTGLEPVALLAILKGVASVDPLVIVLLNYFSNERKSEGKTRTLKIIAADDSILAVPENTFADSLSVLLEHQPKFKNPKLVTIE